MLVVLLYFESRRSYSGGTSAAAVEGGGPPDNWEFVLIVRKSVPSMASSRARAARVGTRWKLVRFVRAVGKPVAFFIRNNFGTIFRVEDRRSYASAGRPDEALVQAEASGTSKGLWPRSSTVIGKLFCSALLIGSHNSLQRGRVYEPTT